MKSHKFAVSLDTAAAIIVAIPLIFLCAFIDNSVFSSIIAVAFWLYGIVYALKDIKSHFALFSYNVGLMIFIFGGYIISLLVTGDFSYFSNSYFTCTKDSISHACFSVMICSIVLNTGYKVIYSNRISKEASKSITKVTYFKYTRLVNQIIIFVIVISYICQLIGAIETLILVRRVTYYASDNYLSALPAVLSYIASLYYISLFLYWSTFPSKKGIYISIISLLVLESIVLLSGERGEPISAVLTIIFYLFLRNKHGYDDIKIPKKTIIAAVIIVPFVMYGLQMISYTRDNKTYEADFSQGVQEFLGTQGGSVRIIARAYDLRDTIEEMGGNTFVLGELRTYLKNNVFARLITGDTKRLRNVDDAYSGDNFLRTYGYAFAKTSYLRGVGGGSTYIAEVYHDGGYILLIISNILYAFLFCKLDLNKGRSVIGSAIMLNIFRYVPLLPRGMALDWLTNTFAIQNIIIYLLLYFISKRNIQSVENQEK